MEELSVKGYGLYTMCRLCLSRDIATLDIFAFSTKLMAQVADVIMKCAPVQITRCDEMPNLICQSCYTQLEKTQQFQKLVVQSDQTLRRYLQQLRTSNKQIKAECSIQGPSDDPLILNTDTSITMKCESELLDVNVDLKEEVPSNLAYKISEGIPLKSEIKAEAIDYPTECTDNLIDALSEGEDSIELRCENSEMEEQSENVTGRRFDNATEYFAKCKDETKNTSSKHKKNEKSNKIKYKCDICNKCFNHLSVLNNHRQRHTGKKPYPCDICNKSFSKATTFKKHQRMHTDEKPHQCDVCGRCFALSNSLCGHKRIHTGEKPYQCDVCNKSFRQISVLNNHRRIHTGEKPYQCDVCSKCFSEIGSLRRHQRVHTGEKPFKCDVCNNFFSELGSLRRHQRIHTGEKSYQCDECDKRFSRSQHLKRHLEGVHKKSMIYKCTGCDETFRMKSDLNWHIQDVHNVPN